MSRHHSLPALVGAVSFCFAAAVGAQVTANTHSSSNIGTTAAAPSANSMNKAATSGTANAKAKVSSADRKFMDKAAQGNMAEVQMGKLATEKANADQVKQFGQRMVDDHTKANDELKQIASQKDVTLPTTLGKSAQNEYDKLAKLSGADFDQEFMKHMVSDHKKVISEFKSEANKSKADSDVKQWAQKTLPTLQEHLTLAQQDDSIARNESKTKTSSTASRKTGS